MKFTMITSSDRYFWVIYLLWATCFILGALSVETVTPSLLPRDVLKTLRKANASDIKKIINNTRRIIYGLEINQGLPFMVYLKLPATSAKYQDYRNWLCGGVIIHEEYILTSAACIEDVKNFYVVSGTYKFSFSDDRYNNPCIKNGAKKAVWKCIPRNYVFDGHENDNIRWMNNDIAVVKLEDEFDFHRRVRGCDYTPRPICYNNASYSLEDPGNQAFVAGWGSTDKYNDWVNSRRAVSRRGDMGEQALLRAPVMVLKKPVCKKLWGHRYHNIIDNYMICTADISAELSDKCQEKYVDCTDVVSASDEEGGRRSWNVDNMSVHSARHNYSSMRRAALTHDGGFCENDHGGPLIHGDDVNAVVIGIISACLVKERTNKCYGPFLYTSVYKNRVLINCAVYKVQGQECNKLFRASVTHTEVEMSWVGHPDGPAKTEMRGMRRKERAEVRLAQTKKENPASENTNITVKAADTSQKNNDSSLQHAGIIVRAHDDEKDKKDALIAKMKSPVNETKT